MSREYHREYQRVRRQQPEHKEAAARYQQEWQKKNREHIRERERIKRAKRTDKQKAADLARARRSKLRTKYGITDDDYQKMLDAQNGLCAICRDTPPHGKSGSRTLCVDHCHETGAVRGLLCSNCNKAIGLLRDDPNTAAAAYYYLSSSQTTTEGTNPQ